MASSALAPETQRAPSYALQHQSVVGYTPTGILGTSQAPAPGQGSGVNFNSVPGQPTGNPNLALQLPFGSRVTQIVAEAVFPADDNSTTLITNAAFNIGSGLYQQAPMLPSALPIYQYGDLFLENTLGGAYKTNLVFRNMGDNQSNNNITGNVGQGSVGYIQQAPNPEINFVNLGEGTGISGGSLAGLQDPLLLGAEFKVIVSYVVVADNAESYLSQAINQARPSVRGA
jgi:hypothetical protein